MLQRRAVAAPRAGRVPCFTAELMVCSLALAGLVGLALPPGANPVTEPEPEPEPEPIAEPAPAPAPVRRRDRTPPWSWRFVGIHYGTGVMASLLVLPGSYALAGWVGHRGKGLGPVVGGLLIGAFLPPVLTYTVQWAVGRRIAPRRERYWPGLLVHQAGHLGVFAGAILGGADFRVFREVAPVVLTDALVVSGLGSLTAEATRRPRPAADVELSWQRHQRLWGAPSLTLVVPLVEVALP